jgi:hypothetical protein
MKTQIVEVTNGQRNWGKFLIGQFDEKEFARGSVLPGYETKTPLVFQRGWGSDHFLVLDLETGEGAMFHIPGSATADLNKHQIWVCPMFEPFLEWLYANWKGGDLPPLVDLPDAPFAMSGYRRKGQAE